MVPQRPPHADTEDQFQALSALLVVVAPLEAALQGRWHRVTDE